MAFVYANHELQTLQEERLECYQVQASDEYLRIPQEIARNNIAQGCLFSDQGKYDSAIRYFTHGMRIFHGQQQLYVERAFCYLKLGQHMNALNDVQTAIAIQPTSFSGFFIKGLILKDKRDYGAAEKAFLKALEINKGCKETKRHLRCIRRLVTSKSTPDDRGHKKSDHGGKLAMVS